MGTHAHIGILNDNGTVDESYLHYDGYVSGAGVVLLANYTDPAKIKELISMGDLSVLDGIIHPDPQKPINSTSGRQDGVCLFFGRKSSLSKHFKTEQEFIKYYIEDSDLEYIYLFKNNCWHYLHNGKFENLARLINIAISNDRKREDKNEEKDDDSDEAMIAKGYRKTAIGWVRQKHI